MLRVDEHRVECLPFVFAREGGGESENELRGGEMRAKDANYEA